MTSAFSIMTVCTGNICRSPMAAFMIADAASRAGLDVEVDSTGTTSWEVGNPMDDRAAATLLAHGVEFGAHTARHFEQKSFAERDLILALDTDHYEWLLAHAPSLEAQAKVHLLRSFDPAMNGLPESKLGIYDPWYGNEADFQASWEMINSAIPGILELARG